MLRLARQLYESGDVDRALETVELVRSRAAHAGACGNSLSRRDDAGGHALHARARPRCDRRTGRGRSQAGPRDDADRFRAHTARGNAFASLGEYSRPRAHHAAALAIAERIDNVLYRVHALGNVANVALGPAR